jgi:hypothetical protein
MMPSEIPPLEITISDAEVEEWARKNLEGRHLLFRAAKRLAELGDTRLALELCDLFEIKMADDPDG